MDPRLDPTAIAAAVPRLSAARIARTPGAAPARALAPSAWRHDELPGHPATIRSRLHAKPRDGAADAGPLLEIVIDYPAN